jgi:hypothetical protein
MSGDSDNRLIFGDIGTITGYGPVRQTTKIRNPIIAPKSKVLFSLRAKWQIIVLVYVR